MMSCYILIMWFGELLFFIFYVNVVFGATSVSFYLLTSEFQNNGQAFVQSKKHLTTEKKVIAPHLPSLRYVCVCRYVCVHAPVDVHVLGGAGGGFMCRPVIWWHLQALPMQQCGWHCGSLHRIVSFSFFFFSQKNVISSLAASLHMGSLHPAVVFIITAVLFFLGFFCSSGCTWPP